MNFDCNPITKQSQIKEQFTRLDAEMDETEDSEIYLEFKKKITIRLTINLLVPK